MSVPQKPRSKSGGWSVLLVVGLAAVLAFAVGRLFSLRFAQGDIYPPYSSLRADPLGSKVLADAIGELPGFSVERSYRQLSRLKVKQPATIVYLGIDYTARIDEKEFEEAERIVKNGARLVITFARELGLSVSATPVPAAPPAPAATPGSTPAATPYPTATPVPMTPRPRRKRSGMPQLDEGKKFHEAAKEWGVSFRRGERKEREAIHSTATPADGETDLDPSVPWHTALFFKDLDPAWRTLYRSDGEAVVIERSFGSGTIVLCTDTYFLSNEGLHAARVPKLVARVVGPPRIVVFDEFHNGVTSQQNVAGLARKHGLGGAILALLCVAALFIWRNAVPLLPPQKSVDESGAHVVGIDAGAGFVNLLRRGVPAKRILAVCIQEWRKCQGARLRPEENAHVESVVRAHEGRTATKDTVAAYKTIAAGLNRR